MKKKTLIIALISSVSIAVIAVVTVVILNQIYGQGKIEGDEPTDTSQEERAQTLEAEALHASDNQEASKKYREAAEIYTSLGDIEAANHAEVNAQMRELADSDNAQNKDDEQTVIGPSN